MALGHLEARASGGAGSGRRGESSGDTAAAGGSISRVRRRRRGCPGGGRVISCCELEGSDRSIVVEGPAGLHPHPHGESKALLDLDLMQAPTICAAVRRSATVTQLYPRLVVRSLSPFSLLAWSSEVKCLQDHEVGHESNSSAVQTCIGCSAFVVLTGRRPGKPRSLSGNAPDP